ncbi:hypothetical protein AH04_260 [Erwinia phage AH04]|uniref:Uncharacterized protein n=1 Tax=Erwinia phage AH04 TaxID=2869569 RepID=A0AAE7X192_9CAUD|nr:hypothetical protein PQC02_gp054 [Erwinia phage AH04]QZA70733.1 hypothetical protein AH04_260 [Erwinia phage AH04]
MSVTVDYKDRNIVSRSFRLMSEGIKDPEKVLVRSDYDLYTSFFSTAVGDNKFVNPLPGFSRNTDPYPKPAMENKMGNQGRYYKRIHQDNALSATFTAGVAEFTGMITFILNMFDYSASIMANKGRAPTWAFYIGQAAGAIAFWPAQIVATSFNFFEYLTNTPKNKWYYCKPSMGMYFTAAQGIFNDLMISAGYSLSVLPADRQDQGNTKAGDRDFAGGGAKGYQTDTEIAKNNISYMHSLFPDAINPDGTIDILKVSTRGVRKFRHFMKEIKNLDDQFGIRTVEQKDQRIEGILNNLMADSGFVNANGGSTAGTTTREYLMKELKTVGKARGMDELNYPEVASAYTSADAGQNIKPVGAESQATGAVDGSAYIAGYQDKIKATNSEAFGLDGGTNTAATTQSAAQLSGTEPTTISSPSDVDESSWLGQIGTLLMDGFYGGLDGVTFRTEGTGSVSDSFSNSTTSSAIASTFNSTVTAVQDFKFNIGGGQTGIGIVDEFVNGIKDAVAGVAAGSVIGNVPLALLGNSKVEIPDHWEDSTTNLHSESFSFYFEAPYAHPYSIATNIFLPLSLLMPFIVPFSTGGSTYTTPFLVKVFSRGKSIIRTGIIQNASFEFGSGPLGWTTDMKPRNLRVNLTVTDLDKVMSVPISRVTNPLDLLNVAGQSSRYLGDVGKYNDWVNRTAGIDYLDTVLRYNDLNRRLTRFTTDVKNIFKPATIAGVVNDSIVGDISRIFTGRPLNR